jgi:putative N6-adenine-specific DNA methylase
VFVSTAPGLEAVTAGEILRLGFAGATVEAGGVSLRTRNEGLRRLNVHLRTASRVLVRLASFRASSFGELERKARKVPWGRILPSAPGRGPQAPLFDVTSRKSRLYHSGAVTERLQRSLHAWGERRAGGPSAVTGGPPPRFVVRLSRDELTLSADASGEHLHRRGYRQAVAKAPLRETVAAALLLAAEWEGDTPLFDPFCGSGTLVIEAALLAGGIPPGHGRRFAFEGWPGFRPSECPPLPPVQTVSHRPLPVLAGADRDAGAIRAAAANAERAGVADAVSWTVAPLSRAPFPPITAGAEGGAGGLLVTNPPWGRRVGDTRQLRNLYSRLGTLLRERWAGGRAVVLCPDRALVGQLGFPTWTLFRTRLGGVPVEALAMDVPGGRRPGDTVRQGRPGG